MSCRKAILNLLAVVDPDTFIRGRKRRRKKANVKEKSQKSLLIVREADGEIKGYILKGRASKMITALVCALKKVFTTIEDEMKRMIKKVEIDLKRRVHGKNSSEPTDLEKLTAYAKIKLSVLCIALIARNASPRRARES
jgi:hypothetical protein